MMIDYCAVVIQQAMYLYSTAELVSKCYFQVLKTEIALQRTITLVHVTTAL